MDNNEIEFTKVEEPKKSIADRIVRLEFAEPNYPEFVAQKNKEWVRYGTENDYLTYLINLFDRNAEHNSIITGKSNYISGKGLAYDKTKVEDLKAQAKLDAFLSYANQWESYNDILPKMCLDLELFNGYALQLVFNGTKLQDVYFIQFNKIRLSKDGKTAFYCEDWNSYNPEKHESFKSFSIFSGEPRTGTFILYYKVYRPTSKQYGDIYPVPDYIGCTADIDTDIAITEFHYSNLQDGMSAPGMLNFYNGEPTEEDKRKIVKKFTKNHTGSSRAGRVVFNFVNEDQKGVEFVEFPIDRLDKMFEILSKRLLQKIFTGHKVTNPVLFGIKTEGQLGNRNELLESYEHFNNTYIELRRPHILDTIKLLAELKGVVYDEIYIEPATPIGLELPLNETEVAASLSFDEKRQLIAKKYGIELTALEDDKDKRLTLANKLGVGGVQSLLSVIQSQIPAEQKVALLNGVFGVSLAKAYKITGFNPLTVQPIVQGQNMSTQKDPILTKLLAIGKVYDGDDEVLEERFVDFDSDEACEKFEKEQFQKFAVASELTIKTLRNKILEILSGAPETKPEILAKQLGLDLELVTEQINSLIDSKLLIESEAGFTISDLGLDKAESTKPLLDLETYTIYKYAVRDDAAPLKTESRPFCKDLMSANLEFTREDIKGLSNEEGTNVWVYRGGFYTNPNTDKTTPFCRHIWKAITRSRRKK